MRIYCPIACRNIKWFEVLLWKYILEAGVASYGSGVGNSSTSADLPWAFAGWSRACEGKDRPEVSPDARRVVVSGFASLGSER